MELITPTKQDIRGIRVSYEEDVFWDSDYTGDIRNSGSIAFYVEEKYMGTTVVMLMVESLGDWILGDYTAKETVIIVASVIILLFGLAFVFGYVLPYLESGNLTSTSESKNITISGTALKKNFILWKGEFGDYTYTEEPDSGKIFLECNLTINNNGYDDFSTNPFYFYLTADNIKYDVAVETSYVNNWDSVEILNGGVFHGTLIFQIPESASSWTLGYDVFLSDCNIIWNIN